MSDLDAVRAAIRPGETKVVWVETPTNPLLNIADIEALAGVAHEAGALLVVDNTFASPYLQQPLTLGADVVVHSTTKYCGGHSDVVGGALVVRDLELAERLGLPPERDRRGRRAVRLLAGAARAEDAGACGWTGTATTPRRSSTSSPGTRRSSQVIYPGLPDHPGHAVAARQMKRYGGMVSFRVAGGEQRRWTSATRTGVFTLAESLGGVESLIEHPGRMTHASVAGTDLEVPGRPDPAQRRHRDRRRPGRRPRPRPPVVEGRAARSRNR